ncbi:MAG: response regulator [Verrucomicrobiales bacterium]
MTDKKKIIFLIENSTDHVFLLEQAFRQAKLFNPLKVARYGNEAILYLKGVGIYGDRKNYPIPDIIILDMTIADGSALSVLGWIRRQPQFSTIPILALVLEEENRSVQDAFDKGANAYFVKRDDLCSLAEMIKELELISSAISEQAQEPAPGCLNKPAS